MPIEDHAQLLGQALLNHVTQQESWLPDALM